MKLFFPLLVLVFAAHTAQAVPPPAHPVEVILRDGAGKQVGTARIAEDKKGVKFHLTVEDLSPGEHAIHFHAKGTCAGPDFKSAGDHFSPQKKEHGLENPKGPHAGDMRNFTVGADGKASVDVVNKHVTLGKSATSLLRSGGTSLVIHAKPDDYKSQPAGESGDRVVCGEIRGG